MGDQTQDIGHLISTEPGPCYLIVQWQWWIPCAVLVCCIGQSSLCATPWTPAHWPVTWFLAACSDLLGWTVLHGMYLCGC